MDRGTYHLERGLFGCSLKPAAESLRFHWWAVLEDGERDISRISLRALG